MPIYYLSKGIINKLRVFFLLIILITGVFVTLTRTLWVTSFLVILTSFLIYLIIQNKLTPFRAVLILLTLTIPILLLKDSLQKPQAKVNQQQSIQYRTQSISKPLEDASFLMRVEAGYNAFQKFLDKPVFGNGMGDFIKYKII